MENASVVQLCEDEPQDAIPRAVYHVRTLSVQSAFAVFHYVAVAAFVSFASLNTELL